MIRKGFLMKVRAQCHDEYRRRHDQIWPELSAVLREHGVGSYSIYLDARRSLLFAHTNPDDSPVTEELAEVFHLSR